jgi:solute carrier family 66 (lysosomal lysine-arginine transporter), member 1
LHSAEGISLTFLFVWFIGDLTNLIGSSWAQLVPTVIALAVYFCIADAILISQCLYYNILNSRKPADTVVDEAPLPNDPNDPSEPLIRKRSNSNDNIGLPGSRRRSSVSQRRRDSVLPSPRLPTIEEEPSSLRTWLTNSGAIVTVCILGSLGWVIAWKLGAWKPTSTAGDNDEAPRAIGAEILGYISAIAYLGLVFIPIQIALLKETVPAFLKSSRIIMKSHAKVGEMTVSCMY